MSVDLCLDFILKYAVTMVARQLLLLRSAARAGRESVEVRSNIWKMR